MEYKTYLQSQDWKIKRNKKLERKLFCSICGTKNKIDIHHLQYKNLFDIRMKDLLRLCRDCHFILHDLFKKGKVKFQGRSINVYELRKRTYFSQMAIIKIAIKKARNLGTWNKANHFIPYNCFQSANV